MRFEPVHAVDHVITRAVAKKRAVGRAHDERIAHADSAHGVDETHRTGIAPLGAIQDDRSHAGSLIASHWLRVATTRLPTRSSASSMRTMRAIYETDRR